MQCSRNLKNHVQRSMLRSICKQISELPDDHLENTAEELLTAITFVLDEQDGDDGWGTEGWKRFFGYAD